MASQRKVKMVFSVSPAVKASIAREVAARKLPDANAWLAAAAGVPEVPTVRTQEDIERALQEALESGPAKPMTRRDWRRMKDRLIKEFGRPATPRKRRSA